MVYQVVNQDIKHRYPGILICLVATYTFCCLAIAIINVIKYNKMNSPVLSAIKTISLAKALLSIFALQTAMFVSFGGGESLHLQRIMNGVFGGCLCFAIFCFAVYMAVEVNKHQKTEH